MLNPEHGRGEAMVEIRNAANVQVFSMKAEGNYPVVWAHGSRNLRFFGYGGNGSAWPGWALFRFEDCRDFLLANIAPQLREFTPGAWTGLAIRRARRAGSFSETIPLSGLFPASSG
jgi:hypothetical protein